MIGAGYVVSSACFADFGHQVNCIDKLRQKLRGSSEVKFQSSSRDWPSWSSRIWSRTSRIRPKRVARRGNRCGFYCRRRPTAPRRWLCRSELCLSGRARSLNPRFQSAPATRLKTFCATSAATSKFRWFQIREFLREGAATNDRSRSNRLATHTPAACRSR